MTMRVSDILFISFVIVIFINPIEKYNWIYKSSNKIFLLKKIPIQYLPITIKILLSCLIFLLYLTLDFFNTPSFFIFSYLNNTVFYPLINVLSLVSGEVLIAIVGLIFTILTLFYTSTTSLRRNDVEAIFKLVDLLENNIKLIEKKKVDKEFQTIKEELDNRDFRRIFLLKKTISENKVELKESLSNSKFTSLNNEQRLVLDKMNSFIDTIDISVGNLEQLMSLLIRKEVLTFKSHKYKRKLIKSYLSNKEFQFIQQETTFFQIIKENYDYLIVFKDDWLNLDFIRYIFNITTENDQSFNNIFRLIHRTIKITNSSSLRYLEKKKYDRDYKSFNSRLFTNLYIL